MRRFYVSDEFGYLRDRLSTGEGHTQLYLWDRAFKDTLALDIGVVETNPVDRITQIDAGIAQLEAERAKLHELLQTAPLRLVRVAPDFEESGFNKSGKIETIKALRTLTNLGLKEAKDATENLPFALPHNVTETHELVVYLTRYGAQFDRGDS